MFSDAFVENFSCSWSFTTLQAF